ncbi:uncharacterized protein KY384_004754 [Bacidia gigantensis]|uniref:uncharacterized protein n=1 Tax=Bacidia gigantensis TaxID=2732470 RepID=UPI001D046DBB|nr:uncharacterized protein KY384_004754 [Bacidia gigantensis]KAG8530253.1 hypothetical protein KY384_004754 [Bacidia gigantensis]
MGQPIHVSARYHPLHPPELELHHRRLPPPGSPIDQGGSAGYSSLPTHEPRHNESQSLTVKSTGIWVWNEALNDSRYGEDLTPINYILLCVISGIIGLVLTGFTAWHISLAYRGMTTIECLEQTRYLSPLRKTMRNQRFGHENGMGGQNYGQQLAEIHANAVPGVTRAEEGEVMLPNGHSEGINGSGAYNSLRKHYAQMEQSRERVRYEDYLDEKESENLPSAFNLGWRRNMKHLFGERPLLWALPICNTTGDGWNWEPSHKWLEAREAAKKEREAQPRDDQASDADQEELASRGRWHDRVTSQRHYFSPDGSPSSRMSMQTLRRKSSFEDQPLYDDDNDDDNKSSSDHPIRSHSPAKNVRKQD